MSDVGLVADAEDVQYIFSDLMIYTRPGKSRRIIEDIQSVFFSGRVNDMFTFLLLSLPASS
jgi:hypothetical protein